MFNESFRKKYPGIDDDYNYQIINYELTDMDKAYMVINYPRDAPHAEAQDWTLDHALDVAGVEPKIKKVLLSFWEKKKYKDLRKRFNIWNGVKQGERPKNNLPNVHEVAAIFSSLQQRTKNMSFVDTLDEIINDPELLKLFDGLEND
jgi:hypothetical protein